MVAVCPSVRLSALHVKPQAGRSSSRGAGCSADRRPSTPWCNAFDIILTGFRPARFHEDSTNTDAIVAIVAIVAGPCDLRYAARCFALVGGDCDSAVAVCCDYVRWLCSVAMCCGCVLWLCAVAVYVMCAVAVCCGGVLWICAVAMCCGCLCAVCCVLWLCAVAVCCFYVLCLCARCFALIGARSAVLCLKWGFRQRRHHHCETRHSARFGTSIRGVAP